MYRWLIARGIRLGYQRMIAGDPRLLLGLAAPNVRFQFPGTHSFAADVRGRDELAAWLQRFLSMRPAFTIHDVVVTGMPWNTRAAVRFSDAIGAGYRNEGVEYLQLRWGRAHDVRVFLDTEVIAAWEQTNPAELAAGI